MTPFVYLRQGQSPPSNIQLTDPNQLIGTVVAGGEAGCAVTASIGDGATISSGGQSGVLVTANIGDGAIIASGGQSGVSVTAGIGEGAIISSGAQAGVAITASAPIPPTPVSTVTSGDPRSKPKRTGPLRQPAWAHVKILGPDGPERVVLAQHARIASLGFPRRARGRLSRDVQVDTGSRCLVLATFAPAEPFLADARAAVHAALDCRSYVPYARPRSLHSVRVATVQNPTDDELITVFLASI